MIISGLTIRKLNFITPFNERTVYNGMTFGLGPAGYDVRVYQSIDLAPGAFALASVIEYIAMLLDLVGFIHDKSTLARLGISLFNTIVEPARLKPNQAVPGERNFYQGDQRNPRPASL